MNNFKLGFIGRVTGVRRMLFLSRLDVLGYIRDEPQNTVSPQCSILEFCHNYLHPGYSCVHFLGFIQPNLCLLRCFFKVERPSLRNCFETNVDSGQTDCSSGNMLRQIGLLLHIFIYYALGEGDFLLRCSDSSLRASRP